MKLKIPVSLIFLIFFGIEAMAQVGLKPLQANMQIRQYLLDHPDYHWNDNGSLNKWGTPDTLDLPFFEDFSQNHFYPDSSRWLDNNVFINSDIPVRPPSYGAATFDFLDQYGNPYGPLEKDRISGADTLTSQFIDLGGLTVADSVIMTFFYQPMGRGDFLTNKDSLKLDFRVNDSTWVNVWSVGGGVFSEFVKVNIRIEDEKYLKPGFQFRFENRSYQWGNNNHWHLDYIFIDRDRTENILDFPDYTIQSKPTSLLKNYYAMPYAHYLADPGGEAADSIYFRVGNQNDTGILAEVRHLEQWKDVVLVSTNFQDNVANVPGEGNALRRLKSYDFTGLTGDTVVIKRSYYVKEAGLTNEFIYQRNDSISVEQRFENFFARDDGTAESGFGFNDLKNATGNMAVRFTLNIPDTLRAISYFFTPNIEDPSKYLVRLKIWQDIAFDGGTTVLLWDSAILLPDFNEDGFGYRMFFPGNIALPAGDFYIGWEQTDNFNISIGFDKNYGYRSWNTGANPNIYYHVGGEWIQNSNSKLSGEPMIRAFVGSEFSTVSTNVPSSSKFIVYPNPAMNTVQLEGVDPESWCIYDISGKQVLSSDSPDGTEINVSSLDNGMYFLVVRSKGSTLREKIQIIR